jgi:hypothetical protein
MYTLAISIGTLAVAVVIAVITYQQHLTNRLRLRHELFERRFAVFKTAQVYLSKLMHEGRLNDENFSEQYPLFMDAWQRSRFLFGQDIADYLDSIAEHSREMRLSEMQKKHEESAEHLRWLCAQPEMLFDRFSPYLRFPVK